MYYAHFGLREPPFKITPNTEVFFKGGNRGAVLDALMYAIQSGEGIIKVVGEVGSGKTMLCRMLQTILPLQIESIYLANPSVAPEDVLHAIAFELQLKLPKNADRLKVMQALQTHLLKRHEAGKQVVIFVEEAQGMPLATLEEIRLLSNLETKHDKLLQIVLFGQPELDENLNQTNIRQLRERITHSFNLAPLQSEEIGEYLIFRLRAAGYFGPHLFNPPAIRKLSNAAQGLVRRVNILADKALLSAYAENVYQVTPKHVEAAIADSEFGMEKSKAAAKKNKFLMLAGLLALGLALGFLASNWRQSQSVKNAKTTEVKSQANVEIEPVVSDTPNVINKELTQPSATPILSNPTQASPATAPIASAAPVIAQLPQPTIVPVMPVEAKISPVVAPINNGQVDILSRRLIATQNWLSNQPPSTVSIQLMGASSDEQLKADLEKLGQKIELDNIYVFRTKVNNLPFLTVLYGSYNNRFEATQALQKLPEEIQKNRPQLRTIAGVLQETK
jgi:type II secretory pathway predicted ATPase ExeA/septal ring-binding cell division protein DamX